MTTTLKIETEYDDSTHQGIARATIDGQEYSVCCRGLAACGEAFCEPSNPFSEDDEPEQFDSFNELRDAAVKVVKDEWNYNGSEWSEPVNEPDMDASDDDTLSYVVRRTEFHGGSIIGYFESKEDAQAWVDFENQGTDCVCGCYEVSENEIA